MNKPARCCQPLLSTHCPDTLRGRRASLSPGVLLVARGGVEPPTFRFSVGRSYQLSYLAGSTGTRSGQTSAGSLRRAQLYRRAHRSPNHDHPSASRAGKPPVATGPHDSGVTRSRHLPCSTIAERYSSQLGCSPEIDR